MPNPRTHPRPIARGLALAAGAAWVILSLPALLIAGLSMTTGNLSMNPVMNLAVHACVVLPVLTVWAAIGSFKASTQGDLRSVAIHSAAPVAAAVLAALALMLTSWR